MGLTRIIATIVFMLVLGLSSLLPTPTRAQSAEWITIYSADIHDFPAKFYGRMISINNVYAAQLRIHCIALSDAEEGSIGHLTKSNVSILKDEDRDPSTVPSNLSGQTKYCRADGTSDGVEGPWTITGNNGLYNFDFFIRNTMNKQANIRVSVEILGWSGGGDIGGTPIALTPTPAPPTPTTNPVNLPTVPAPTPDGGGSNNCGGPGLPPCHVIIIDPTTGLPTGGGGGGGTGGVGAGTPQVVIIATGEPTPSPSPTPTAVWDSARETAVALLESDPTPVPYSSGEEEVFSRGGVEFLKIQNHNFGCPFDVPEPFGVKVCIEYNEIKAITLGVVEIPVNWVWAALVLFIIGLIVRR